MSVSISRHRANLFGIAAVLVFGLGLATPALARGMPADDNPTSVDGTACSLLPGSSTCTTPLDFFGNQVFVYDEGIISIGTALTPGLSFSSYLSTVTPPFVAAALADYTGKGLTVSDVQFNEGIDTLRVAWVFKNTGSYDTLIDLDLTLDGTNLDAAVHYGYQPFFGLVLNLPAGCATCAPDGTASDDPNFIVGDQLLPGTLTGSNFDSSAISFDSTAAASSVPEPGALPIMAFGLCAMGAAIGFSRRRRAPVRTRA